MKVKSETVRVVVVDDENDVADLYATWLEREYDVETTYDGQAALDAVDEQTDVVLLDRQMPGLSGDDVLQEIRSRELDCRVVMVTAVDPDFDIVEMAFDDYLTKPVTREELLEAVDEMLTRQSYDDKMQRFFAMASKKATLETEKNPAELEASEEYAEISDRVEELRSEADQTVSQFQDFESAFRELGEEE